MDGGKSRRQQRPLHVGADVSFESSIYILPLEGINLLMDPHSICCLVIILQCFFLFLPLPGPFLPSSLLPHAPYPNLLAHLYPFIYLFYLSIFRVLQTTLQCKAMSTHLIAPRHPPPGLPYSYRLHHHKSIL